MIFHGVIGKERRDAGNPSFFNIEEIMIVEGYLCKLINDASVASKDIGIITPYRKQVLSRISYIFINCVFTSYRLKR